MNDENVARRLAALVKITTDCHLNRTDLHTATLDVYDAVIQEVERPLLRTVLARVNGNQVRAARILGINRNTLRKKMRALGILPA